MSDDKKTKQKLVDAGKDQTKLESGDDLALEALSQAQANDTAIPDALNEGDDEVLKSNEVAETLRSLQNLIERNANMLDELKDKLKKQRDSLRSVFDNDTDLNVSKEQADQFTKEVKERKSKLLSDPTVVRLQTNIGELNTQKNEIEEALSNHLVNYYQLTNSKSFDTSDGDQREFVVKASIKSARKKN
ncbi:MAG: hypothetical protein ABFQ62_04190 [Patescibacteria group bacterium]